jgi:glycosyltransferase involved in cell wall biosynthesis
LLEALARHLPVLATACPGGTVEILVKGEYGKLVPPDDVPAMTKALDVLLSDQDLRDAYASKAQRAVMGLDVATVAKRWLDIMTGLTG